MKSITYFISFILQIAAIFMANYLADVFFALFLIPILLAAAISALIYYKNGIRSMWSCLWLNFGASFVYILINKFLSSGITPPNDAPQLLIVAIIFMALLAAMPVIPVCLFYGRIVEKSQKQADKF